MNNTGVTGQFFNWPDEGRIENSKRKLAIICILFQTLKTDFEHAHVCRGVISGGGWGGHSPQLLANKTFFGFSHTTDRKAPSEAVLMGSFMSVIYGNVC